MNKKQMALGTAPLLLLRLLEGEDMYGYKIIEELYLRSDHTFEMKAGTLYPLLHGLEDQGLVTSYNMETTGGRVRKYYHITEKGSAELAAKTEQWRSYTHAVNLILGEGVCNGAT